MTANVPYNILISIEGQLLGLDNSKAFPTETNAVANPLGDYAPYLQGKDFQGLRLFPIGLYGHQGADYKVAINPYTYRQLFDDFDGVEISPVNWNALAGTGGSPTAPAISVLQNGAIALLTGTDATATMATNGSQLTGALNWLVSAGATRFEARIGNLSAATAQSICFGLCDVSTISAPFSLSGTTTIVKGAGASNAACFVQDSRATFTGVKTISMNAGGTPQTADIAGSIVNVTANKYNTYRIEIDAAGDATFFIDGVLVATQALAVATTALLCPTIGMFASAATAETLYADYVYMQAIRT